MPGLNPEDVEINLQGKFLFLFCFCFVFVVALVCSLLCFFVVIVDGLFVIVFMSNLRNIKKSIFQGKLFYVLILVLLSMLFLCIVVIVVVTESDVEMF